MSSFDSQIQCEDLIDPNIENMTYPHLIPLSDEECMNNVEMFLDI